MTKNGPARAVPRCGRDCHHARQGVATILYPVRACNLPRPTRPPAYTDPMPHPSTVAAVMASIAVAACAAPATEPELRVLVKLAQASSDGDAIARRAGDVSGVPVRYVAASSPQWHALALRCGDASSCDA